MGGFSKAIAEGADQMIGSFYKYLSEKAGSGMGSTWGPKASAAGKGAVDILFSMNRSFDEHPLGAGVKNMIAEGIRQKHQSEMKYRAPVDNFEKIVKQNPDLAVKHDYNTASIKDIYNGLPQNHAARQALDPLMMNRNYHDLTIHDVKHIMEKRANIEGRAKAFGPDGSYLAANLYPLLSSQNPLERSRGEAWMDMISQIFRDNIEIERGGQLSEESATKKQVADVINKSRARQGLNPLELSVKPGYEKGGPLERLSHQYTMNFLAPWIAIAHLGDFFKLPSTIPAAALWKTFQTLNDPTIASMRDASGIFTHTLHSIYDNDFNYRTGMIARRTDKPGAAAIFHKMWHQPLFNNLRMSQLSTMGTAAYHSAQMWGKQAFHGDKLAIKELEDLHLDVNAIVQRGGNLTNEELEKAMFHFTNNRLFIEKPLSRSYLAQKNQFFRLGFMLHGYATREAQFMSHELYKYMQAGDWGRIAQFAGTVAVLFPAAAPLLESASMLMRTASPSESYDHLKDRYDELIHPKGMGEFAYNYLTLLGHFGGAGAFMTYLHAANQHRLAATMLGPQMGTAVGTVEDIAQSFKEAKTTGKHNLGPAERDILRYYTLPIIGPWAAQHLVPKRKVGETITTRHRMRPRER